MAAGYDDIAEWFDWGHSAEKAYMIVWCDMFDYDDYPAYYEDKEAAQAALDNDSDMQRAMECYDLASDRDTQLDITRAWALRRNYS